MFRNLRLYRLHSDWPATEEELSNRLEAVLFKPCGSFTERSSGWEEPAGGAGTGTGTLGMLARRVGGADLLKLRTQTRILPPAAVNEALDERLEAFRSRTQREPSRKEKRDLKDETHAELMPKALLKSDRVFGFCLLSEKLLGIDTASENVAERFLDRLRSALGSLQITPLTFGKPVSTLLTQVFLGGGPPAFTPGRECRMLDPSTGSASVSWMDIDLSDPSVQKHVRDGLKLDRLALSFDELLTCVIDQEMVIRKLRFSGMDGVEDDAPDVSGEDPLARLDAEFVLLTGTLHRLVGALKRQLNGFGGGA